MISRKNYEEKFLDYFEGSLSEPEIEELLRFIAHNPDLEAEFYLLIEQSNDICLTADDFSGITLKRESKIGYELNTFDYLCVASLENEISADEETLLGKSLENPKLRNDFNLYQKVKVVPDEMSCPFKEELKKSVFKYRYKRQIASYSGIAAAVLLVFYFAYYENGIVKSNSGSISQIEESSSNHPPKGRAKEELQKAISAVSVSNGLERNTNLGKERYIAKVTVSKHHVMSDISEDTKSTSHGVLSESRDILQVDRLEGVQLSKVSSTTNEIKRLNVNDVEFLAAAEKNDSSTDLKLATNISSFLAKAKVEGEVLAEAVKDTKGRKRGILIGRLISGTNAVLGTNMHYSSKYASDGKLIAVNFEAGSITYSKNYDDAK